MNLAKALRARYPNNSERIQLLRQRLEEVCIAFIETDHGDGNAMQKLCSADDSQYWQQLSEVLVANQLLKVNLPITHPTEGPDFVFDCDSCRIWIEVICPEPRGIPDDWTKHISGTAVTLPHEAILLRWSAAIKEKAEKLLGKPGMSGYLDKQTVGLNDVYVIAVNGRLLRGFNGVFPELTGISQYPYAVEATFALGPLQVAINKTTLKATEKGHQHRPLISKSKGNAVPADTFFDPKFAPVSAIWAVDLDELLLLGEVRPMAVIHNPLATNRLRKGVLPAQSEYEAVDGGAYFQLTTQNGRSAVA